MAEQASKQSQGCHRTALYGVTTFEAYHPGSPQPKRSVYPRQSTEMPFYILIIAIVAGVLRFVGLAASIAKVLVFLFLIVFIISLFTPKNFQLREENRAKPRPTQGQGRAESAKGAYQDSVCEVSPAPRGGTWSRHSSVCTSASWTIWWRASGEVTSGS